MRGEIFSVHSLSGRGHEQQGRRYAVIVQGEEFATLSTVLIAPTSTSAEPVAHRPGIVVRDVRTQVLVEQTRAVAYERLGQAVGRVSLAEMQDIDDALKLVLGLR